MVMPAGHQDPFRDDAYTPKFAKVLVFGDQHTGKTHFALGAPMPAVADAENGTTWFRSRGFTFKALKTAELDGVHAAISFLESGFVKEKHYDPLLKRTIEQLTPVRTGVHDYETFIVDSLTVLWEQRQFEQSLRVEHSDRKNKEDFTWLDQGAMKRDYKTFLNRLIQLPLHVVCTARLGVERDNDTKQVIGEKPDAEKSTMYSFDLALSIFPAPTKDKPDRRDAIIHRDRSRTYRKGDRVENVSWKSFVEPILKRLQTTPPREQLVKDMVASWRADGLADDAALAEIQLRTSKTRSQDLTDDEIVRLTRHFTGKERWPVPGGDDGGDAAAGSGGEGPTPADPGGPAGPDADAASAGH